MKTIIGLGALLCSFVVYSNTYIPGTATTIKAIDSYNHGAVEGHIRILVNKTVPGCDAGYFVQEGNTGINRTLSIALSAFHSDSTVVIGGRSGVDWSGSSNSTYCQVHAITLQK